MIIINALLILNQLMTPNEKIDDEDGHYIVTEDMHIGDRCESYLSHEPEHHSHQALC